MVSFTEGGNKPKAHKMKTAEYNDFDERFDELLSRDGNLRS